MRHLADLSTMPAVSGAALPTNVIDVVILVGAVASFLASLVWGSRRIKEARAIRQILQPRFDSETDGADGLSGKSGVFYYTDPEPVGQLTAQVLGMEPDEIEFTDEVAGEAGIAATAKVGGKSGARKTYKNGNSDESSRNMQLLEKLSESGRIFRRVDHVTVYEYQAPHPSPADYLGQFLQETYPDGFDGTTPDELLDAFQTETEKGLPLSGSEICDHLKRGFEDANQQTDPPLFLIHDEWSSVEDEDQIRLSRTDVVLVSEAASHPYPFDDPWESPRPPTKHRCEMPDGIEIFTRISKEDLSRHGRKRLAGLSTPTRLSVFGQFREYLPEQGSLEITPLLVFTRH